MILRITPVAGIFPTMDSTKEHPDMRRLQRIQRIAEYSKKNVGPISVDGDTLEISADGKRLAAHSNY